MSTENQFIKVTVNGEVLDSTGEFIFEAHEAKKILESIQLTEKLTYKTNSSQTAEVFDFPYLVEEFLDSEVESEIKAKAQYGITLLLNLNKIYVDYKDRFIIYNEKDIPCVLSDNAQNQLFDLCDEFTDEDITLNGVTYSTPPWLSPDAKISDSKFWSEHYVEKRTDWDLNEPAPCLVWALKKFKLPKMRIAVLGCGRGHDAAYLASMGHKVTAFDFSSEAIDEGKALYPNNSNSNLTWVCADIFNLDANYLGQFDLIFDHTLFCAIDPANRDNLLNIWSKLLAPQGQILGIFFIMPKPNGPPYGTTEEEIHTRITKKFRKDFWERSRIASSRRIGRELVVLATKQG